MRAVVQRVVQAHVEVSGRRVGEIGPGILTLLGVQKGDTEDKARKLIRKICELRIFEDASGKMNQSLIDVKGRHLIVSQFTLAADCSTGRRPSFGTAEAPETARRLYEIAIEESRNIGVPTASGIFQADMKVSLINDGPVTFILDL